MINIILDCKFGYEIDQFLESIKRAKDKTNDPSILLFKESTFNRKFTKKELEDILADSKDIISEHPNFHTFFAAFVGGDSSYKNTGYLISSFGGDFRVQSYEKLIYTLFETVNEDTNSKKVLFPGRFDPDKFEGAPTISYCEEEGVIETIKGDGEYMEERPKVTFPKISIEGKKFIFCVCIDNAFLSLDKEVFEDLEAKSNFILTPAFDYSFLEYELHGGDAYGCLVEYNVIINDFKGYYFMREGDVKNLNPRKMSNEDVNYSFNQKLPRFNTIKNKLFARIMRKYVSPTPSK